MKEYLQKLIYKAKNDAQKIKVIFLNNVENKTTNTDDYNDFSVIGEYLNEMEAEEIRNSLLLMDFRIKEYNDEIEFIRNILYGTGLNKEDLVVLNMAQKGTKIGRKSLIPAFCDMENISYTGSNPYAVSLCRNKYHTGCILEKHGIYSPKSWLYLHDFGWLNDAPPEHLKIIAKPNNESCSMGVDFSNIGKYGNFMKEKITQMSKNFKQDIIVQQFINGYEVEVPCIVDRKIFGLTPMGINFEGKYCLDDLVLTYEVRVKDQYKYYNFCDVDPEASKTIKDTAEKVIRILGVTGFGRVDFRVDKDGRAYVIDIATNPHVTKASSFTKVFELLGFSHHEMIGCLIALAK